MNRCSLAAVLIVLALASLVKTQSAVVGEQFFGKLDAELSVDMVHVYQRQFEPVGAKDIPQFVPPLAKGTAVSSGDLIARTGEKNLIGYIAEPTRGEPLLCIDLDRNGKVEAKERFELKSSPIDANVYRGMIRLPINNQHFKTFPIFFSYLRAFKHPRLKASDKLTFQSVWAFANGTVKVKETNILFQYPFEPTEPAMSTTEGLFGVDADGDGKISNEEFSPETSYAAKTEIVFRVGDRYLSTSKIDLAKNEITVRTRTKDEYLRHEIEVGRTMPDFSFVNIEGKSQSLYEFKGKYVLIDFWGVWCRDCTVETPFHIEAYKRFKSRGFEILGLDTDEDIEVLKGYVKEHNLTWPQARNDSIRKLIEERYRIQEYPSTILIGPDAKVLVLDQKDLRGERLLETLERILPK